MKYFDAPDSPSLPPCWGRLALTLLAVPLMIMSCGTAPQVQSQPDLPQITATTITHPQAYFHFLRGYLAEMDHESSHALEEYRQGLEYDPTSVYLKIRVAHIYFAKGEMAEARTTPTRSPT